MVRDENRAYLIDEGRRHPHFPLASSDNLVCEGRKGLSNTGLWLGIQFSFPSLSILGLLKDQRCPIYHLLASAFIRQTAQESLLWDGHALLQTPHGQTGPQGKPCGSQERRQAMEKSDSAEAGACRASLRHFEGQTLQLPVLSLIDRHAAP